MSLTATSAWSPADVAAFSSASAQMRAANTARRLSRDGAAWTEERLGEHLWSKQVEILNSVRDNRYTAVKACHGPGKSRVASRAAAWWMETHPAGSARVVTTAPTGDQVKAILWSEINNAASVAEARGEPFRGRVNETEWKLGKQLVAFGRKPSDYNPHAFQGIHARYVLVILDEACGIVKHFWTAARAITTGEHCRILAIGNPDDPGSEFRRVCGKEDWNTITISAFETPNFTGEWVPQEVSEALVGPSYVEDMRTEYGEQSPVYIAKVLGEFPDDADDGVVRYSSLRACTHPEPPPHTDAELLPVELGVDLGAGGDETVIQERRGMVAGRVWTTRTRDSMQAVGKIVEAIRETGATAVKVDVIGIGWGIVGRLRELAGEGKITAAVVGVNVAEASTQPEKYRNLRSQIWWEVGRKLAEDRAIDFSTLDTPYRDKLFTQLTAPKYVLDSSGRIVVEPKAETKIRLGRSPDNADSLLLAYYTPPGAAHDSLGWLKAAKNAQMGGR
ncbi:MULTISPECIES: hypothetical protein [Amycolatopsis]|uniref:Terminase n=1 Tax=Amycolatopsis albidoflavus TaxID=102226 RepID=A0ABW5I483_9PSEU